MGRFMNLAFCLLYTTTIAKAKWCDETFLATPMDSLKEPVVGRRGTCTMSIKGKAAIGAIIVTFKNVNLTYHATCDVSNSIAVHDGDSSGAILGLVCGNYTSTFQSSGNVLTLRYPSAEVTDTNAFDLEYRQSDISCYGPSVTAVSSTEYSIFSVGYPVGVLVSRSCYWFVRAPEGQRVRVSIETAGDVISTCQDVNIRFGNSYRYLKNGYVWCPGKTNVYQSWGFMALLRLKIPPGLSIRAKYRALEGSTCRGDFRATQEEQFLMTPGYPNPFPSYLECRWEIKSPDPTSGSIRIDVLEMELVETDGCSSDVIRIYDGKSRYNRLVATACRGPATFYVYGHSAMVQFKSLRDRNTKSGFKLKYYYTRAEPCGGSLVATSTTQNVTSPGYPANYPNSVECVWAISADNPKSKVRVTFLEAVLLDAMDVVRVYDGNSTSGYLLGQVSGTNKPSFTSQEASLSLVFITNERGQTYIPELAKSGFVFGYVEIQAEPCGGSLVATSTTQNVTSPGYPANYPNPLECVWTISADSPENKVRVTFLEAGLLDGTDVVRVYDGDATSGYLLGQVSGNNGNPTFTGQEASLTLVFTATDNGQKPSTQVGFVFGYVETQVTPLLQRSIEAQLEETVLMSPRFPGGKVKDINATWTVRSKWDSYEVLLSFLEVDVGDVSDCNNNYISVYQGYSSSGQISKICDNETGTFLSRDRELSVVFRTDSKLARRGFKAEYKMSKFGTFAGCFGFPNEVRVYPNTKGNLESPLYPNKYPNLMNCSTLLKSIFDDHYIQLEVTDMNMPHPEDTGCTRDFVEFFDGPSSASPSLGRACGQTKLTVTSKHAGQDVLVMFISDSNKGGNGYMIKYSAVKEVGQDTESSTPVGLTLGIIVGCLALILLVGIVVIIRRRSMRKWSLEQREIHR
ncbi:deleted in malignant brain tumors 1 protein-like isoform X1 [Haliotis rufescens]|uniref:deleted in malignant brain tumors 1 protein-like isoform X1 n=1 Tax=Haliotis rufescens TaxID=6454 RepID=UPI00201E956B|nr:deleted in malignant brain tumors 1 protein-like isoform X1 [Haliotis rufescens]